MGPGMLTASYITAAVLFILSLGGLSRQESARRGNLFGIIGITIAIAFTVAAVPTAGYGWILTAAIPGAVIGGLLAARVAMTSMPELVAILHSFVGLA
ncbi:MAG: NAD(P)(+) transhydrogenase (Re/Si-specific) subunit beta, partial [Phycisphaerae bacterium]|nr:NAD(P)(+) transhydrogenase (Re/Si-specific) subunit beta [Phycisphaerae bacterium]